MPSDLIFSHHFYQLTPEHQHFGGQDDCMPWSQTVLCDTWEFSSKRDAVHQPQVDKSNTSLSCRGFQWAVLWVSLLRTALCWWGLKSSSLFGLLYREEIQNWPIKKGSFLLWREQDCLWKQVIRQWFWVLQAATHGDMYPNSVGCWETWCRLTVSLPVLGPDQCLKVREMKGKELRLFLVVNLKDGCSVPVRSTHYFELKVATAT